MDRNSARRHGRDARPGNSDRDRAGVRLRSEGNNGDEQPTNSSRRHEQHQGAGRRHRSSPPPPPPPPSSSSSSLSESEEDSTLSRSSSPAPPPPSRRRYPLRRNQHVYDYDAEDGFHHRAAYAFRRHHRRPSPSRPPPSVPFTTTTTTGPRAQCSHCPFHCYNSNPTRPSQARRVPSSVIIPRAPPQQQSSTGPRHPAPVPPYVSEQTDLIFSAPTFLHLYLSPGHVGLIASPVHAHNNPDVTRPAIILHPGKDYKLLMARVGHIVKSINPPAWGVSDLPPGSWEGWGVKLFLPKDGPRIFKDIWTNVGDQLYHLEIMALESLRWDEEVEMYGRLKRVMGEEDMEEVEEDMRRMTGVGQTEARAAIRKASREHNWDGLEKEEGAEWDDGVTRLLCWREMWVT
ncbi:hypothetical protein BDZ91DRAFT_766005 [Kalaharituber pfeilii]|nr:hypothetical protein BDZ91DRAFT_766005 [Kalaharituber pfeilii]